MLILDSHRFITKICTNKVKAQLHNSFPWHQRSQSYLLFRNFKLTARLMRSTASLSRTTGKRIELRSRFNSRGSIGVLNILIQNSEKQVFYFCSLFFQWKQDLKQFSHVFEIRMKTQILATMQTEAPSITWKSGLLTECIQIKNGIWKQICIWGQTKAPDRNFSKVWYESKCG